MFEHKKHELAKNMSLGHALATAIDSILGATVYVVPIHSSSVRNPGESRAIQDPPP